MKIEEMLEKLVVSKSAHKHHVEKELSLVEGLKGSPFEQWVAMGKFTDESFARFDNADDNRFISFGIMAAALDQIYKGFEILQEHPFVNEAMKICFESSWLFMGIKDGELIIASNMENKHELIGVLHTYVFNL